MKMALFRFVSIIFLLIGLTACGNSGQTLTVTVSGRVTANGVGLQGVTLTLSGISSAATTDANGNYQFSVPANNPYTITPTKAGYTFNPASKAILVTNTDSTGNDFTGTAAGIDLTAMTGTWTGRWTNNTYGTTGSASLVVTETSAAAAHAVLTLGGSVFGGVAPAPISLDASFPSPGSPVSFEAVGTQIGDIQASIGSGGELTAAVTNAPDPSISKVDVTGTVSSGSIQCAYTITFSAGGTATGTFTLSKYKTRATDMITKKRRVGRPACGSIETHTNLMSPSPSC